ncbi:Hypothetical predicted protein [Pelobates cultripes]|uniref:Uncharacterized protein n=1 Tax=Pelobates cultripes TaxID=61616 RepID=A0AAD1VMZ9_PELCU|nr:Hypothetical predicted protein [Pelobates cultripes]
MVTLGKSTKTIHPQTPNDWKTPQHQVGRKGKKIIPNKPTSGLTIGEMWRQAQGANKTNMATLHGRCSDFSDKMSHDTEEIYLRAPNPPQKAKQRGAEVEAEPITTTVLKALLADLQRDIHEDVAALRGDLRGLTSRITKLEGSSQSQAQYIAAMQQSMQDLQNQTQHYEHRLAAQEDAMRRSNIKIRGVPENVPEAELPKLIGCLLPALLPHRQTTPIIPNEVYRIPKPAGAPTTATRDVIITLRNSSDKATVLTTHRSRTPFRFKGMELSFYADLSRGTLAWRRSLRPLTTVLQHHKIAYRWRSARTLVVLQGTNRHTIQDIQEALAILQTLGLPQDSISTEAPTNNISPSRTHTWNP